MRFGEIKRLLANPGASYWYDKRFAIANEFGIIALVFADNADMALDEAADSGHLRQMAMSDADYQEYEAEGWDDSYILAGNASEPFWCEYLRVEEV